MIALAWVLAYLYLRSVPGGVADSAHLTLWMAAGFGIWELRRLLQLRRGPHLTPAEREELQAALDARKTG